MEPWEIAVKAMLKPTAKPALMPIDAAGLADMVHES